MACQYYEYSVSLWPFGWRKEGGICILILQLEGPACPMCSDGLCSGIQWTPASSGPGRWEREETRRHRNRKPEGWKSLAWSPLIRDGTMMSGYTTHFHLKCLLKLGRTEYSMNFLGKTLQLEPLNTCRIMYICTVLTICVHMYRRDAQCASVHMCVILKVSRRTISFDIFYTSPRKPVIHTEVTVMPSSEGKHSDDARSWDGYQGPGTKPSQESSFLILLSIVCRYSVIILLWNCESKVCL